MTRTGDFPPREYKFGEPGVSVSSAFGETVAYVSWVRDTTAGISRNGDQKTFRWRDGGNLRQFLRVGDVVTPVRVDGKVVGIRVRKVTLFSA